MVRRLALAIRRANANVGPGAVGWGAVDIKNLTQNRSIEAHLYDHGIHLGYGQGSAAMDPMGFLHTIDDQGNVMRVDRVQGVVSGHWSTTAQATKTYEEDYNIAAAEFAPVLTDLRQAIGVDLKSLEDQLENLGAPWTPGRLPTWKPE